MTKLSNTSNWTPYGMVMPGKHGSAGSGYRYGFQGQEKDDEVKGQPGNSINYKYRMHDPRVGRFFAVDPLTSKYPWYTPYQFSGNKVIAWLELEGLEEYKAFQRANGDFLIVWDITARSRKGEKNMIMFTMTSGEVIERHITSSEAKSGYFKRRLNATENQIDHVEDGTEGMSDQFNVSSTQLTYKENGEVIVEGELIMPRAMFDLEPEVPQTEPLPIDQADTPDPIEQAEAQVESVDLDNSKRYYGSVAYDPDCGCDDYRQLILIESDSQEGLKKEAWKAMKQIHDKNDPKRYSNGDDRVKINYIQGGYDSRIEAMKEVFIGNTTTESKTIEFNDFGDYGIDSPYR